MLQMPTKKPELSEIDEYIQANLDKWLAQKGIPVGASSSPLCETRFIRLEEQGMLHTKSLIKIEEELKHHKELMQKGFEQSEKRFEQSEKRFEQSEKRFEQMQEQSEKRFNQMQGQSDQRFETLTRRIDRLIFWSLGLTISATSVILAFLKYFS